MTVRRSLALLLLTALAAGVWLGVRGLEAKRELTSARAQLTIARTDLLQQQLKPARAATRAAGITTARAHQLTDDAVWKFAAHIPLLGASIEVVRELATSADVLARQVLPAALASAEQLDPSHLRRADGSIDLGLVRETVPAVARVAAQTRSERRRIDQLPTGFVLPQVARARGDFGTQLASLDDAVRAATDATRLLPALLGADRPRTYFVMIQQTSESRGTGGLNGGFAVLQASGGRLQVTAQGTDAQLHNGPLSTPTGVPQDYLALYKDNGALDLWQNVNLSPDLPVVARVVAARWKQQSGQTVDGVIALDAQALADILRGSPPLDVGGGLKVEPAALPAYLAIGQYRDFPAVSAQNARKERLTAIAQLALRRLTTGGGSSVELARGMVAAVGRGHLRMASDDPALAGLHGAHVDGALPEGPAPVAYPVLFNASGGKLDYFIERSVRYTAGACSSGRRRSRVAVALTNRAPAGGLPPYVTIRVNQDGQRSSYNDAVVLSVYGTRGAQFDGASLDGRPIDLAPSGDRPYLSTGSETGLPVWYLYLDLPRGKTRTLSLDLNEPTVPGAARVPEQPLARPLQATTSVPTCRS